MILLWGALEDAPLREVHERLTERCARVEILDNADLRSSRFEPRTGELVLRTPTATFHLSKVTGFYPRPFGIAGEPTALRHPSVRRHLGRMSAQLWTWADTTTAATVLNRPTPSATNSTKTSQTRLAQLCGLAVPPTIVTTDARRLETFAREHGELIVKGAGGTRTVVHRIDLGARARLDRLTTSPTYFQAFITGTNFRVHVLGEQVFSVAITSDRTDYRYGHCDMVPANLPQDILEKCQLVCRRLGLTLAGIDLIHATDGQWYFLEANPSPAFTFFADHREVGAAIADRLMAGPDTVAR